MLVLTVTRLVVLVPILIPLDVPRVTQIVYITMARVSYVILHAKLANGPLPTNCIECEVGRVIVGNECI